MNLYKSDTIISKALLIMVLFIYFLYNIPFLSHFSLKLEVLETLFQTQDGLYEPLLRTFLFALTQAVLLTLLGLGVSLTLLKITFSCKKSKYLSILLIPTILGNVSIAFIFKLILLDTHLPFQNTNNKFITLTFIQFWQYGSLFIYLFWLNQQTISRFTWEYCDAMKLTIYEKIKDVILPKQRNLSLLLFIVAFIFSYYEDAKIQFIFKASRGTNTELVNQWLNRTYQSDSLLSAKFAFKHISQSAIVVLIVAFVGLVISIFIKNKIYNLFIKNRKTYPIKLFYASYISQIMTVLLVLWIASPVMTVLYMQASNFKFELYKLLIPLPLAFITTVLVSFISILFGILNRLAWQTVLHNFNTKSFLFFISLFMLILIPPIVLLITGFKWMQYVGYLSSNHIYLAWMLGHTVLSFPLLSSFSISTHFRVKNEFIAYLQSHNITLSEKIRDLFLLPFQADYLLTFIFAFAMIWNESTINNVLSDVIPSFVTELNKTISGRATDYASGMSYLLVSLFLALISITLWNFILRYHQKQVQEK